MPNTDRNPNQVPTLAAKSNAGNSADVIVWADPTTHRLLVDAAITLSTFADNAAFTAGTTAITTVGGFYHSTIDTVTDGSAAALAMDSKRNLFTVIRDAAGNARGANVDANNNLGVVLASETTKVIGTINIAAAQTIATVTTVTAVTAITNALPAGSNIIGNVRIDQTTPGTTNGTQDASTSATGSAVPAKAGYTAGLAKTANPTAASDGNLVGVLMDKLGKQVVVGAIRDLKGNQFTTITSSTAETTVITAVASTFLDVYGCIVENTSATASKVTFKDSTSGTTQFEIYVPAGDTRGFMLSAGDGFKQTTVNTNWTATCGTSVASIVISMLYVKNI